MEKWTAKYEKEKGKFLREIKSTHKAMMDDFHKEGVLPNQHLHKLTLKERGFVKDYCRTGNASLACFLNYNVKRNLARQLGKSILHKPKIRMAVEAELAVIDMKYVENGLINLEHQCDEAGELSVKRGVYESMMKLKGLGSTKVINENIEKNNFDFKNPKELMDSLVKTVLELSNEGLLPLGEFVENLNKGGKEASEELVSSQVIEVKEEVNK